MVIPVLKILSGQSGVMDDKEILCIAILSGLCEIETPRDECRPVYNHDLVVSNGMLGINERLDSSMREKVGRRVFFGSLAFIEDDAHMHPSFLGKQQGLGNGVRSE